MFRTAVRRPLLALMVVALVCAGLGIGLAVEHRIAKDRRDLHDLTGQSPWPREALVVPDDLPPDGATGWLDDTGLDVAYSIRTGDGRDVPVLWQLHKPDPDGWLEDGVDCGVRKIVTCTDLGDGFTLAVTHKTHNSTPHIALYRFAPGRVVSITVQGPDQVGVDVLRPALTRVHRPADTELLDLLRLPGYQTDWS